MRRRSNNIHAAEGADLAYARLGQEPDHGLPCAQAENPPDDAPTLENPNILVLTDRIDLDDQISKTFVACGLPNPKQASSVAELRDAVARAGNGQILLSTIFKFADSKTAIPNSDNWIVLVDECHRTQEKDLGAFLSATLPDARFFGFTGTPIKSTDKDTYARFSVDGEGYLDKYGIDDAVRGVAGDRGARRAGGRPQSSNRHACRESPRPRPRPPGPTEHAPHCARFR